MAHPGRSTQRDNVFLAGFEDRRGNYKNFEFRDDLPDSRTLARSPRVVIGIEYMDKNGVPTGEVEYATTQGLTHDYDIDDAIDDLDSANYGALEE